MLKGTLCIVVNLIICKSEIWAHFSQDGGHMSCPKQIVVGGITRQLLKTIKVFILIVYEWCDTAENKLYIPGNE